VSATSPQPFGRYELLERLGAGGMAVVYRGKYTAGPGITKTVVIKRVLGEYAEEPAFVEMFLNEARISVGLNHGNIVQVFDFGQVDGEYFLAMEFVDGQPLSRVLKRLKAKGLPWMPAPLAVSTVIELCRGLHHAHTRTDEQGQALGLVHRDISPDNVLVSFEGEVKVSDFGIAKARLAGRPDTEVGVIKGKYPYLAPEQLKQLPSDARADVYAVGVVLFELLCGERPVTGNELEIFQRATEGRHTPARSLNPGLDDDLLSILRRALAPAAEDRYRSAEALQQSLSDWLSAHAPRLPANVRKLFMGWCFQEELATQHRSVPLPEPFVRQIQSWRDARGLVPASPTPHEAAPSTPAMDEWPVLPAELVPSELPRFPLPPAPKPKAPAKPPLTALLHRDVFWWSVMVAGIGLILGLLLIARLTRPPAPIEARRQETGTSPDPASLPPSKGDSKSSRGQASLRKGNHIAARAYFLSCLSDTPGDPVCQFGLATTYDAMGKIEDAKAEYRKYLQLRSQGDYAAQARAYLKAHPP
jgi:eukaryotic-like serine/threonine-protein kinase